LDDATGGEVDPPRERESFLLAYPTKRYRSAWIGIAVHSAQSVFFAIALLLIVL
jgi:hypothetical protein